jgi:serine/threonine-protein phosphatase 2A regulatory subunit A
MTATKTDLPITAVALLIDNLQSEDPKKRQNSVEDLGVIARALGPERTRNELIPFLIELTDDEEDIVIALGQALGDFVNLVGGPSHALSLLKPLEILVCVEEIAIRDKVLF